MPKFDRISEEANTVFYYKKRDFENNVRDLVGFKSFNKLLFDNSLNSPDAPVTINQD